MTGFERVVAVAFCSLAFACSIFLGVGCGGDDGASYPERLERGCAGHEGVAATSANGSAVICRDGSAHGY